MTKRSPSKPSGRSRAEKLYGTKAPTGEKQKPAPPLVTAAAKGMKKPETVTKAQVKGMSGRIMDDEKNDPEPHRPKPRKGR